jgi:hypothetical protein
MCVRCAGALSGPRRRPAPDRDRAMELASAEALFKVAGFLISLALIAEAEAFAPRRRRTVAHRDRWAGNLGLVVVDTILVRAVPLVSAVAVAGLDVLTLRRLLVQPLLREPETPRGPRRPTDVTRTLPARS